MFMSIKPTKSPGERRSYTVRIGSGEVLETTAYSPHQALSQILRRTRQTRLIPEGGITANGRPEDDGAAQSYSLRCAIAVVTESGIMPYPNHYATPLPPVAMPKPVQGTLF
jgi:hypothetical protein